MRLLLDQRRQSTTTRQPIFTIALNIIYIINNIINIMIIASLSIIGRRRRRRWKMNAAVEANVARAKANDYENDNKICLLLELCTC